MHKKTIAKYCCCILVVPQRHNFYGCTNGDNDGDGRTNERRGRTNNNSALTTSTKQTMQCCSQSVSQIVGCSSSSSVSFSHNISTSYVGPPIVIALSQSDISSSQSYGIPDTNSFANFLRRWTWKVTSKNWSISKFFCDISGKSSIEGIWECLPRQCASYQVLHWTQLIENIRKRDWHHFIWLRSGVALVWVQ